MTPASTPDADPRSYSGRMDNRREVQEFLTALRGRIGPEEAGVPLYGGERRVPGLRREEVAQLAGVSTTYYTRIERGDLSGVSDSVLRALVRALHLTEAEEVHLLDLARAASGGTLRGPAAPAPRVRLHASRRSWTRWATSPPW